MTVTFKYILDLKHSEQILINLLALMNIIGGGGFLLTAVIHCYFTPLQQLHYLPDFMVYYTAGHR